MEKSTENPGKLRRGDGVNPVCVIADFSKLVKMVLELRTEEFNHDKAMN